MLLKVAYDVRFCTKGYTNILLHVTKSYTSRPDGLSCRPDTTGRQVVPCSAEAIKLAPQVGPSGRFVSNTRNRHLHTHRLLQYGCQVALTNYGWHWRRPDPTARQVGSSVTRADLMAVSDGWRSTGGTDGLTARRVGSCIVALVSFNSILLDYTDYTTLTSFTIDLIYIKPIS